MGRGWEQRRGDPQTLSPFCSSESLSASSEEPAGDCKKAPHQLTLPTTIAAILLPLPGWHPQTTPVVMC